MAAYIYSSKMGSGTTFSQAFTTADTLTFDIETISAANISDITTASGNTTITLVDGGTTKTIVLTGFDIKAIDKSKFIFADGSKLLIGDGSATIVTDDTTDNTLVSSDYDDYIDGVGGTDTASYASASYGVSVDLANNSSSGGGGNDVLKNIDNLIGSAHNDSLQGDENANNINGGNGTDTLTGGGGNDTYVVTAGDTIFELADGGVDLVQSSIDWVLSAEVDNLTLSGTAIVGTGNEIANTITGNSNANILDGKAGADTMVGLTGNDTYYVDNSGDITTEVIPSGGTNLTNGTDWVFSSAGSYTLLSNVENLRLINDGATIGSATGNSLDNTMIGNGYDNTLDGSTGKDTITDTLGGNDTLIGGDGADTLKAGKGDDTLIGNTTTSDTTGDDDIDNMTGGTGNDTYYVTDSTDIVNEAANPISNPAWIAANNQDKVIAFNVSYALNDAAGAGVDLLTLGGTADTNATGNKINNTITGNTGKNTLNGGNGNDTITDIDNVVNGQTNTLIGGDGADTLTGGAGKDVLIANLSTVDTTGDSDIDTLSGGDGNDTYYVSDSLDNVIEANTTDAGTTDTVNSILTTYTLTDNVENLVLGGIANIDGAGNSGANTLTGNNGNNTLTGGDGIDEINGGGGNDKLVGGLGETTGDSDADVLKGGAGNDSYYVTDTTDDVQETGTLASTNGIDTVFATVNYDLSTTAARGKIENLTMNGNGAVNGTGNSNNNIITGNDNGNTLIGLAGSDSISGGGGNDTLIGGDGSLTTDDGAIDTLTGGDGEDVYVIDGATDKVVETNTVQDGSEDDTVFFNLVSGAATYVLTANVENLVLGGDQSGAVGTPFASTNALNGTGNAFANNITGNDGANTLIGGTGTDTLTGGDGNDTLISGTAIGSADGVVDTLIGGAGNDKYYVTETTDVAKEVASPSTDAVQATIDATLDTVFATLTSGTYSINSDGSLENLTLLGTAASSATGNASANILTGNSAVNTLTGNGGDDKLDGLGGADTMLGGAGNDTYVVDNISDVVTETNTTTNGIDLVQASVTYTISDKDVENLTLTGTSVINGTGNLSDNVLTGNAGVNTLSGSTGADTLDGKAGKDTLTGGEDNDTFVFSAASDSSSTAFDIISDFQFGSDADVIDLSAIDANTGTSGVNDAFALVSLGAVTTVPTAVSAANTVNYYTNGGSGFLIGDTDGVLTTIEFKVQLTAFIDPTITSGSDIIL